MLDKLKFEGRGWEIKLYDPVIVGTHSFNGPGSQ